MKKQGFTTTILHGDRRRGTEFGATHAPVHPSVAWGFGSTKELAAVFQGDQAGFVYGRQHNPTVAALEAKVNAMEGGAGTVCFATGMAAITAMIWALLKRGDHLVSSSFVFGNTNSLFTTLSELGCDVVQGYLYARALSPPAFGRWLLDHSAARASAMLRRIGRSLTPEPAESSRRA